MTEFPLFDLTSQFQKDVQGITADFQRGVLEARSSLSLKASGDSEVIEHGAAASPSPSRAVGKQRLEQAIAAASPLKHSKLDANMTPPPAISPLLSRCGRQAESGDQRVEVRKMPSFDGKSQGGAAPKTPTAVGMLASPSPRPGLLDRMFARGTFSSSGSTSPALTGAPPNATLVPAANVFAAERGRPMERSRSSGENGLENARSSEEGRRPASLDKASSTTPSPSSTRGMRAEQPLPSSPVKCLSSQPAPISPFVPKAKRQRENSMVALYKAMVDPTLQIEKYSSEASLLQGKVASAKKFRRSSLLKKAAMLEPVPVASKVSAPAASSQASTLAPPVAASPEKPHPRVVAASPEKPHPGVSKTVVAKPAAKQKANKLQGPAEGQRPAKKPRPPVPSFSAPPLIEPWQALRQTPLSPKRDEDNYEISDKDENSDEENEPDRSHKHVPKWCSNYLQLLAAQSSTDPDSIFGSKVPSCDLKIIFSDETYKRFGRERPQRRRGSSANWKKDRLRPQEISEYKEKMGQKTSWTASSKRLAASSSASAH